MFRLEISYCPRSFSSLEYPTPKTCVIGAISRTDTRTSCSTTPPGFERPAGDPHVRVPRIVVAAAQADQGGVDRGGGVGLAFTDPGRLRKNGRSEGAIPLEARRSELHERPLPQHELDDRPPAAGVE